MGVFSNNRPNIVPGALISSSYVSDLYDLLSGAKPEAFILSGSLSATGSLQGTASFALNAITASYAAYAVSASYEINYETSSSYAESASYATKLSTNDIQLDVPMETTSYEVSLIASDKSVYTTDYLTYVPGPWVGTLTLNGGAGLVHATASRAVSASRATSASYATMALSASYAPSSGPVSTTEYIQIPLSDETNSLTTGSAKYTFRMPFDMTLTEVRASATTAPSGSIIIVDINQSGTSILSTKLSIDEHEKTSLTATTPAVISTSALVNDAEITFDIDQVGAPAATGKGLKILLKGTV